MRCSIEDWQVPRRCRCKRDTYLYELRDKGKCVYRGITNDVERRVEEHARDGKRFTTYWYSVEALEFVADIINKLYSSSTCRANDDTKPVFPLDFSPSRV